MTEAAEAACCQALFAALDATWPPLAWHDAPGWRVGEGAGGGKRVSAGIATDPDAGPEALLRAQRGLGQPALAMIRPGDSGVDARLAAAGWSVLDPTVALVARVARLAVDPPALTAFEVAWPPLAVQSEIWNDGGIGAGGVSLASGMDVTAFGFWWDGAKDGTSRIDSVQLSAIPVPAGGLLLLTGLGGIAAFRRFRKT